MEGVLVVASARVKSDAAEFKVTGVTGDRISPELPPPTNRISPRESDDDLHCFSSIMMSLSRCDVALVFVVVVAPPEGSEGNSKAEGGSESRWRWEVVVVVVVDDKDGTNDADCS